MARNQWYQQVDGVASGPSSLEELQFLANRGKLERQALVRHGQDAWTPAGNCEQLFPRQFGPDQIVGAGVVEEVVSKPESTCHVVAAEEKLDTGTVASEELPQERDSKEWRERILIGSGILIALLLLLWLLLQFEKPQGVAPKRIAASSADDAADTNEVIEHQGEQGLEEGPNGEPQDGNDQPSGSDEIVDQGVVNEGALSTTTTTGEKPSEPEPPPTAMFRVQQFTPGVASAGETDSNTGGLGDFKDRLEREGGKTGDVQITLIWNNLNDLDLHVLCPSGEKIFYRRPRSACHGELDVDMNAGRNRSREPVENVFWPEGQAPFGNFKVIVHYFAKQGGADPTKFEVAIKYGGKVRKFSGWLREDEEKQVHAFRRERP